MSEPTRSVAVAINRWRDVPDAGVGIRTRKIIGHWHLHREATAAEAAIVRRVRREPERAGDAELLGRTVHAPYADPWGAGHYPVSLATLDERASGLGWVDLDCELGVKTWNLADATPGLRALRASALKHLAWIVDRLADRGTFVRAVYGHGLHPIEADHPLVSLLNDMAADALAGRLPGVGVGCYGRMSTDWHTRVGPAVLRATRLAASTVDVSRDGQTVPEAGTVVLYASPYDPATRAWMAPEQFREHFTAVCSLAGGVLAAGVSVEIVIWLEGGMWVDADGNGDLELVWHNIDMAVTYLRIARELCAGWDGLTDWPEAWGSESPAGAGEEEEAA